MALLQKAYLGSTPLFRNTAWFEDSVPTRGSASSVVTVTASTTANTKGAWEPLITSTSTDVDFVLVLVTGVNVTNTATGTLVDIAKGGSGNETAIAENIAVGSAGNAAGANGAGVYFAFAANIPSGTRISARIQAVRTTPQTASVRVWTFNFGNSSLVPSTVDVLGTSTSTSRGTALSASNAWTPITASTSKDYIGFCFVPSASNASISSFSNVVYELGVGANGSERVIGFMDVAVENLERVSNAFLTNFFYIFGEPVPAGSRLSIRQDQNTTTLDGCIIAIPKP